MRRISVWGWSLVVISTLIIVAALLSLLPIGIQGGEGATPEPNTTTMAPNDEGGSTRHVEQVTQDVAENDCRYSLSVTEYSAFMNRLIAFESVSQMPVSQERLDAMVPFVTETFMGTQVGFANETADPTVAVVLNPESIASCHFESDGTIRGKVVPEVSVVLTDGEQAGTIVHGQLLLMPHFTIWVNLDGQWYVNQETF